MQDIAETTFGWVMLEWASHAPAAIYSRTKFGVVGAATFIHKHSYSAFLSLFHTRR